MADVPPTGANVSPGDDGGLAPDGPPGLAAPPATDVAPIATVPANHPHRTRISGTWFGIILAAVVLTLLLVFILQNTRSATISFFTAKGSMPLGVALLLAAIGGVFLTAVVGSLRILQLRRRLSGATRPWDAAGEDVPPSPRTVPLSSLGGIQPRLPGRCKTVAPAFSW